MNQTENQPGCARSFSGHAQQGFTLVELMVSITLGLLIMVALIAVYLNVSRTNSEMAKTNSLIENGRFAIDILQEDVAHAGFWGGYVPQFDNLSAAAVPSDVPQIAPGPCLPYVNWDDVANPGYRDALIGIPVQTFDVVPAGCSGLITDKKAGTDVLVVRHADTCLPGVGNCEADTIANPTPKVYFQASFCDAEISAATPLRYVLSNAAAAFTLKKRGCTGTPPAATVGTPSERRKFVSDIYYIRTWATKTNNVPDNIPTLVRSTFALDSATGTTPAQDTPVALIEGIDSFVVELGIDASSRCGAAYPVNYASAPSRVDPSTYPACTASATMASNTLPVNRGDGVPETYVRCTGATGCTNAQLRDVVAAKLFILARNREPSPGHIDNKTYALGSTTVPAANDGYKRHVFQTTVRLTNISGRRETP